MLRLNLILAVVVIHFMPHCSEGGSVIQKVVDYDKAAPIDLECYNASENTTVTWFKDNAVVAAKKMKYEVFSNHSLRILKMEPGLIGKYLCKHDGDQEMIFDIKVRPYIKPFKKPRSAVEGDPINLECNAYGVPEPVITWYRNKTEHLIPDAAGKILFNKGKNYETQDGQFPKIANSTLRITDVSYSDADNYTCVAVSIIDGEELSASATVVVVVKDKYAALWPFLGICTEVAVLCAAIMIYEKHRERRLEEEERQEEAAYLNEDDDMKSNGNSEAVRQRK